MAPPPSRLRIAVVDVGSNAIRYLACEVADDGSHREIESERIAIRLGTDVFTRQRRFTPETLQAAVEALGRVRRRLDDLGIVNYRAVATSAVRESRNGGELVERIRRESGIHLETISGSEESHLVWLAVRNRIPLGPSRWLMMDLGGGSVEVSVVDREGILWTESHTLGSVRLLQAFEGEESSKDYQELLERYAHSLKVPAAVAEWDPVGAIATGGNIEALADLAQVPKEDGVSTLPVDDLRRVIDRLAGMTVAERIKKLGLREDRADVILPAAVVYERVAELAGAREILVPRVGLRDGLVRDLVDELHDRTARTDRRERELRAAALSLGRRFHFDEAHAQQVARLALSLFDQLEPLHGLGGKERRLLLAGALLHDIGQYVSYRRHHKHSMYLIDHSELPGLSPAELRTVALLARYHRRSEPREIHPGYQELSPSDREVVRKLSALLRVADALDREHLARVSAVTARLSDDAVALKLQIRGSLALEEWALWKKGSMFQKVFGRPLRLESGKRVPSKPS